MVVSFVLYSTCQHMDIYTTTSPEYPCFYLRHFQNSVVFSATVLLCNTCFLYPNNPLMHCRLLTMSFLFLVPPLSKYRLGSIRFGRNATYLSRELSNTPCFGTNTESPLCTAGPEGTEVRLLVARHDLARSLTLEPADIVVRRRPIGLGGIGMGATQ